MKYSFKSRRGLMVVALMGFLVSGWAFGATGGVSPLTLTGTGQGEVTATNSTKTTVNNHDTVVGNVSTRQYSTTVLGVVQTGATNQTVFNQTVTGSPALQEARDAMAQARAAVVNASPIATVMPAALVNSSRGVTNNSISNVTATNSSVNVVATTYVGPQTIMVGPEQSQPWVIAAGGINVDTLTNTTNDVYRNVFANVSTIKSSIYVVVGRVGQ